MPTVIPASRAARWAAASWPSVSQTSQRWKSLRAFGSSSPACPAHQTACTSSGAPCSAQKAR